MRLVTLVVVLLAPPDVWAQGKAPSRVIGPTAESVRPGVPASRPRAWLPTTALKGAGELTGLCDVLRSEDGLAFGGNEVARARARAEHRRRRVEAATRNYVIDVPPDGFSFREYDLTDRRLPLDTERSFRLAEGVELYSADREGVLDFEIEPDAAESMVKEHAAKKLMLRLVFRGLKSDMMQDACLRLGGGQIAKMRVEVLAYDLVRRDGTVVARGETADFHEAAVSATPVSAPRVTVRRPSVEGGDVPDEIAASVDSLGPVILPCYQKALETRSGLRGTLVVGLKLASDGRIESPKMEVSSLGDEALVSCVLGRVAKARLAKTAAPLRISIPIAFGSRDD